MLHPVIMYLIESALYLLVFLLIYRAFLSGLTHFRWMRFYLLFGLLLSLILPFVTLPVQWHQALPGAGTIYKPLSIVPFNLVSYNGLNSSPNALSEHSPLTFWNLAVYVTIAIYIAIAGYKFVLFFRKLFHISSCIKNNPGEMKNGYRIIKMDLPSPAFSFFNFIFLSNKAGMMNRDEMERITDHEIIHAKQLHTIDILIIEITSILFWFNPLVNSIKRHLLEVHEFIVDEEILKNNVMKKSYSNLLLKLATVENSPILSSPFSSKQISRRLKMINKARSFSGHRMLFLLFLPVVMGLLMSFSYLEIRSEPGKVPEQSAVEQSGSVNQLKVGSISWTGNTIYTDKQLSEKLGISSGDEYNQDFLDKRLYFDDDALISLYLDHGFLFHNCEYEKNNNDDGTIDLKFTIYEGVQAKVRNIIIIGNGSVPEKDVKDEILLKKGDLFSRIKIIKSVRAISKMNKFDPEKILVNPIPLTDLSAGEMALTDIEFKLSEK